jgi:hypothetical protein
MDITTNNIVHRITLNSHDRTNFNDKTSDFTVNIEQISNARCFALRRSLLPLSSYTFEQGDPDSKLVVHNLGIAPNGRFTLGGDQMYVNGFVVPDIAGVDATSTFPTGAATSIQQISFCYMKLSTGQRLELRMADNTGATQRITIPALNASTTGDLFYSHKEFIGHVNQAIAYRMGLYYGVQYSNYAQLQVSTYRGYPNETQNKVENYTLNKYIDANDVPFSYMYYGYYFNDALFKTQRIELWLMFTPADQEGVRVAQFENQNAAGNPKLVSNAIQMQYLSTKQTLTRTLPANNLFRDLDIEFLLTNLWTDYATFTFQAFTTVAEYLPHRLTMRKNNFTDPVFGKALAVFLPNPKLGITQITFTEEYPDGTPSVALAQTSVNLYPGVVYFSLPVGNPSVPTTAESMRLAVNSAIAKYELEFATNLFYDDVVKINVNTLPAGTVSSWDVVNKRLYGFRLIPSSTHDLAGVVFSTNPMDVKEPTPFTYWKNLYAAFLPHGNGPDNSWCVNQNGYYQSRDLPPITYSFPTDTSLTIANLQTVLSTITGGLVATINVSKNTVLFTNATANYFRIEANQRLGIYDVLTPNEDFYIDAYTSGRDTTIPIDISPRNTVLSIGLSLYHDGRTAISYPAGVDKNVPRPLRRNVVATVYNSTQVNYGQYIVYTDQSNTWLPCQDKNISHIRVQIYNDQMGLIDLHNKDLFIELDVLADVL